jgi:hypothetical protein
LPVVSKSVISNPVYCYYYYYYYYYYLF